MSGSNPDAKEAAMILKKSLNRVLVGLYALRSARTDPHVWDVRGNHFLEEEVKLTQEMETDHLIHLCRPAGPG